MPLITTRPVTLRRASYNVTMSPFRLPPNASSAGVRQPGVGLPPTSLSRSILTGGIGFGLVSLCVFATVAVSQRWLFDRTGVTGAFIIWLTLFILLGARAMLPLVAGALRPLRFYAVFGSAFFLYGISWMAAYFSLRNAAGEWLGSLAGSVSMALAFAAWFKVLPSAPLLSALLFAANSIGYFLGSVFYYSFGRPVGLILWGAFYGFCLGAGIGAVLFFALSRRGGRSLSAGQEARVSDEQG